MQPYCKHPQEICLKSLNTCTGNALKDYLEGQKKIAGLKLSKKSLGNSENAIDEIKNQYCKNVGSYCKEVAEFCAEGPYSFCPLIANLCKTAGTLCEDTIGCGLSSQVCNNARQLREYLYKKYKIGE